MDKFLQNILILSQMWVWKDQELHLQELFDQLFSIHGSPVPLGTPKCAFFWSFPQIKLSLQKERQNWSLSSFYCLGSQVLGRELGGELEGKPRFGGQLGASHTVDAPPSPSEACSELGIVGRAVGINLAVKSTFLGLCWAETQINQDFYMLQLGF